MANQSGAKFKEPEVKTPAAPAANAAAPVEATNSAAPVAVSVAAAPASPIPATTTAPAAAAPVKVSADAGKKLYDTACFACHGAGIAGAPKFGDKTAWAARIKQGSAVLYEHAIKGFQGKAGVMPPKGGSTASEDEVKSAVDYMTAAAK